MIETGEIYHIRGEKATGHEIWANRPAVIISNTQNIQEDGCVNVVYVTSSGKNRGNTVEISDDAFSLKPYGHKYTKHVVLCNQIHAIDKSRLESCYGKCNTQELKKIKAAVNAALF